MKLLNIYSVLGTLVVKDLAYTLLEKFTTYIISRQSLLFKSYGMDSAEND